MIEMIFKLADELHFGGWVGQTLAELHNKDGELIALVPCYVGKDGKRNYQLLNVFSRMPEIIKASLAATLAYKMFLEDPLSGMGLFTILDSLCELLHRLTDEKMIEVKHFFPHQEPPVNSVPEATPSPTADYCI